MKTRLNGLRPLAGILIFAGLVYAASEFAFPPIGNAQNMAPRPSRSKAKDQRNKKAGPASRVSDDLANKLGKGSIAEDVRSRQGWFWRQRTFGLGYIPANARQHSKAVADEFAPNLLRGAELSSWVFIGPMPTQSAFTNFYGDVSGRINSIAVHPTNPDVVLVGGNTGGIWRTNNASTLTEFIPVTGSHVDVAVGSIAFSQIGSVAYAAMGDRDDGYLGTGVLKSTDAGMTWTHFLSVTMASPHEPEKPVSQ